MAKNYIQLPPKEGYCKADETAKEIMHKLYGDPHRVIAAYRKRDQAVATDQTRRC